MGNAIKPTAASGSHEELCEILGGEPDDSGQLCELADEECETCLWQYLVGAHAWRGERYERYARLLTCECGGHWMA